MKKTAMGVEAMKELALAVELAARSGMQRKAVLHECDRLYVQTVLKMENGNQVHAAKVSGDHRNTLGRLIAEYEIDTCLLRKTKRKEVHPAL
jgi:DNA-binding NtrC family response regulator